MDLTAWTEAQRSVIGSLLLDPEHAAGEIFQSARPEFFGDAAMRHVFEAALSLWSEARPIDPVTLLARAGDDYQKLLAECMRMTPTAVNVEAWIAICRDAAKLTAMQAEAMAIINARTADEAAAACERMNGALSGLEDVEDLSMSEMIGAYLDRMNDKTPPRYLTWGIDRLNDVL